MLSVLRRHGVMFVETESDSIRIPHEDERAFAEAAERVAYDHENRIIELDGEGRQHTK